MKSHVWDQDMEDKGLSCCTVCHGAEASLTDECPGEPQPHRVSVRVMSGDLNFVAGTWWQRSSRGMVIYMPEEYFDHLPFGDRPNYNDVTRWGGENEPRKLA